VAAAESPLDGRPGRGPGRLVGQPVRRKEDPRLLRGEGLYVADVELPELTHAAVLRSPHAHARIAGIDTSAARALPGVLGVFTADDFGELPTIPVRVKSGPVPQLDPFLQAPLARGKVRYVGDPVAVVVAESRYEAEDALAVIEVDYEPLEAVTDIEEAAAEGAPLLVEAAGTNVADNVLLEYGDADAAFRDADHVTRARISIQRHGAVPMETRGLVASAERGRITVWGPTKVPYFNRFIIADMLGMPLDTFHFIETDVGGGFGARGEIYPEDVLLPLLALRIGRPVKWIEDRLENLVAMNHSREQLHDAELALTADGRILGLRVRFTQSMGAYVRTHGIRVPEISADTFPGAYKIPSYRCEAVCVMTNKTPAGTYRAPGRYESNLVRERLMDLAAEELGIEPVEIRRRNLIRAEDMPYAVGTHTMGTATIYDGGDPPALLDRALELIGYDDFPARREEARREGRRLGISVIPHMHDSGLGGPGSTPGEYARVAVDLAGGVTVYSGVTVLGQGLETTLAQVVADELGMELDQVTVRHGDTDLIPFGGGTWSDRSAILGGNSCYLATKRLKERIREVAGRLLEASADDVEVDGGRAFVRGSEERGVTFGEVARATFSWTHDLTGDSPGLEGSAMFHAERFTHAPGVDAAVVDVDPETGAITILDYVIVFDIGRMLNPKIVEGQLVGGAAQGIGGALLEDFAYADEGGQPLAATFMDYLLPGACEMPLRFAVDVLEEHRSPLNPLGLKGAGEVGTAGVAAALAGAVSDAIGVQVARFPLSPERVLDAIEKTTTEDALA
jgi:carbon-monoxide dehydrogenase large subunit